MTMYVEAHFVGGTPIDLAAQDAMHLANRLDCAVKFKFNDVTCFANPGQSPAVLAHNWRIAADRGGFHPTCSSHPTDGSSNG